jgi:sugar phosphate isomerase/epimerase
MVNISIVQGRLSPPVGGHYQYFPAQTWREEFALASQLGFDGIEWIISDYSNPIFDERTLNEIEQLTAKHRIKITSISLDVLMYHPIFKAPWDDVVWLFDRIVEAVKRLRIKRVSIPIEENSGLHSPRETVLAVETLRHVMRCYSRWIPFICLETDLSPQNAHKILASRGLEHLGLLIDTGNIAANGFALDDFIKLCRPRVYGLHIKDRTRGLGPTCPLGQGEAEIKKAIAARSKFTQLSDITLQAYRTPRGYLKDAKAALKYVKKCLKDHETK